MAVETATGRLPDGPLLDIFRRAHFSLEETGEK
jgi:hypothetical protein